MLDVKNVSKVYGRKQVLKNISFHLDKGESLGILGPNGAGKTTLLKIISGLISPSSGKVISKYGQSSQRGAIFDDQRFLNHLSGLTNIRLFMQSLTDKDFDWDEAFAKYGLHDSKNVKYKFYSSGMKRRLDLMSIFIEDKSFYVLDEATNGLDIDSVILFIKKVINLIVEESKTFIISSHRVAEMEKICDRFLILNEGRILKEIKKEEALLQYGSLENAYCSIISNN